LAGVFPLRPAWLDMGAIPILLNSAVSGTKAVRKRGALSGRCTLNCEMLKAWGRSESRVWCWALGVCRMEASAARGGMSVLRRLPLPLLLSFCAHSMSCAASVPSGKPVTTPSGPGGVAHDPTSTSSEEDDTDWADEDAQGVSQRRLRFGCELALVQLTDMRWVLLVARGGANPATLQLARVSHS
jgi:hypothetical protein